MQPQKSSSVGNFSFGKEYLYIEQERIMSKEKLGLTGLDQYCYCSP